MKYYVYIIYSPGIHSERWQMDNELEIKVSNMMANRIIYMDKTGENYKKFYNINFAAKKRENIGEDGLLQPQTGIR